MRISDWVIIWQPGAGQRTLLGLGQTMDAEVRMAGGQATDVGRPDFAVSGIPVSRGNRRRRIEFSRIDTHASPVAAWLAVLTALTTDPWGKKETLRVTPRGGAAADFSAVLLSTRHRVLGGPLCETLHHFVFRIAPVS